jgi:hypothetical protein
MNKEVAMQWIETLRSGEFGKLKGALGITKGISGDLVRNRDGCRCALGVLREVLIRRDPELANDIPWLSQALTVVELEAAGMSLVGGRIGLFSRERAAVGRRIPPTVTMLNDNTEMPLAAIAEVIAGNWDLL